MGTSSSARVLPARVLPDGTPLQNRLLAALPSVDYDRIARHLRLESTVVGEPLHEHGHRISDVYFPNGGVFSITNRMRDGALVEVATVGREGMLGIGVFLGDHSGTGRTFQQVADGPVPALGVAHFVREAAVNGAFREMLALYAQASLLQTMQCTACNALHDVTHRCCRWLLQTHDRVDGDDFLLKQEFLAIMLGVRRPTVTVVLHTLQETGLISSRYGRMRVLKRRRLEAASCECYAAIRDHFARLGL
jgi:CRP-like cAMP-binding protein